MDFEACINLCDRCKHLTVKWPVMLPYDTACNQDELSSITVRSINYPYQR